MRISDWSSDVCSSDLPEAFAVHGLSNEFLKGAPTFEEKLPEIFDFLDGDTQLVIHNAAYDVGFLRAECNLIDHIWQEYPINDTLNEAAKKFLGDKHSLEALCNRFDVVTTSLTTTATIINKHTIKGTYHHVETHK